MIGRGTNVRWACVVACNRAQTVSNSVTGVSVIDRILHRLKVSRDVRGAD